MKGLKLDSLRVGRRTVHQLRTNMAEVGRTFSVDRFSHTR